MRICSKHDIYYVHLLESLLLASAKTLTFILLFCISLHSARDTEFTVRLPVLPCYKLCIVIEIIR